MVGLLVSRGTSMCQPLGMSTGRHIPGVNGLGARISQSQSGPLKYFDTSAELSERRNCKLQLQLGIKNCSFNWELKIAAGVALFSI